jgi:ribose transport system substrate-binding protein
MTISGLGPRGERAVSAKQIALTPAERDAALAARFKVAVVLHTTTSDWSRQELAGIVTALGEQGAAVVDVVDCNFDRERQVRELRRLAGEAVDAIISIPVGNLSVADAHRAVGRAGKRLVLLDNAPTGLMPGADYAAVVSADNFGLGSLAAELLSPHVPEEGVVGILTYATDFFATNEREIAFRKWIAAKRPDVTLVRGRFGKIVEAGSAFDALIAENEDLEGLFVAWDVPAMNALAAVEARGRPIPVTTVDLGNAAAAELARDGPLKGIAAQRPYEQGSAAGLATIMALTGRQPPSWIALPGFPVTQDNVVEAYQVVWHQPAPFDLRRLRRE